MMGVSVADRSTVCGEVIPISDRDTDLHGWLDWDPDAEPAHDREAAWLPDPDQLEAHALPFGPHLAVRPHVYQREAVCAWLNHGGRGVVVLPTGAGKTVVALMA